MWYNITIIYKNIYNYIAAWDIKNIIIKIDFIFIVKNVII